ncbi:MAG: arginine--tRNA ligase, partial [Parcubacteria group bacterium]|nr:arginine--tRNA ligase [Parcubacteria group bacterium]
MLVKDVIKSIIQYAIEGARKAEKLPRFVIPEIQMEHPAETRFGDYSSNICMKIAGLAGKPPRLVGEILVSQIGKIQDWKPFGIDYAPFEKIEIAGAGFLNFYLSSQFLVSEMLKMIQLQEQYGRSERGKGVRALLEHTSVNPNKAMHIGHIRNSILGDSLARILNFCGYETQVENYIDDTGVQVADLITGLKHLNEPYDGQQKFDHYCWDVYTKVQQAFEKEPELKEKKLEILKSLEEGRNDIAAFGREIVSKVLKEQLETLSHFSIYYDFLLTESSVLKSGLWDEVFEKLKKTGAAVLVKEGKHQGCWAVTDLDLPNKEGLETADKVLVTSHGNVVYTAKDIAHHLWKFGKVFSPLLFKAFLKQKNKKIVKITAEGGRRSALFGRADSVYTVVDSRQSYSFDVIRAVFKKLGYEKELARFKHIAYNFVSLSPQTAKELAVDISDGRSSYPMSGRKGIGVKVDDLLELMTRKVKEHVKKEIVEDKAVKKMKAEDIAVGAIKAYMLKFHPNSELVFDFNEAMKLTGDSGPYLQYSHARIQGILRKAGASGTIGSGELIYREPEELEILSRLRQFGE